LLVSVSVAASGPATAGAQVAVSTRRSNRPSVNGVKSTWTEVSDTAIAETFNASEPGLLTQSGRGVRATTTTDPKSTAGGTTSMTGAPTTRSRSGTCVDGAPGSSLSILRSARYSPPDSPEALNRTATGRLSPALIRPEVGAAVTHWPTGRIL